MLRLSYSFLNTWEQGRTDEALLSYFHVNRPTPQNYVQGKRWDEYAQEYIKNHGTLPPEWGEDKLTDYTIQHRIQVPYNASWELVGVYDVLEPQVITELKSGKSSSGDYAGTMQIPIYMLLSKLSGLPIDYARIIRFNQNDDTRDRAIIYNTPQIIKRAENYLDSLAPEIEDYFSSHNLFRPEEEIKKELIIKLTNNK